MLIRGFFPSKMQHLFADFLEKTANMDQIYKRFRDISTLIRGFFRKSVDKYLFAVFWKSAKKRYLEKKPRISKSANKKTADKEDRVYSLVLNVKISFFYFLLNRNPQNQVFIEFGRKN